MADLAKSSTESHSPSLEDIVPLAEAVKVWARVAALSFGGPAGQIAVMHRIVVDEKRWVGEHRFLHALNYCMLLPGPEAHQLAIYIGWLLNKTKGGMIAGLLFVLPGFVAILALSYIYVLFGNVTFIEGMFFGLKCAVLAVVIQAVFRIGSRALKNPVMVAIAAAAFVAIFFLHVPFPLIIIGAGVIGYFGGRAGIAAFKVGGGHKSGAGNILEDRDSVLGEAIPLHARPNLAWSLKTSGALAALWLFPVAALLVILGPDNVFSKIGVFFSQMAVVTFGGAYAVLAYVAQAAVEDFGWLRPGEMLDGLGMAETTPGPLIMVTQFVGFLAGYRDPGSMSPLAAATFGAILTTWVTFLPSFLWIFAGAPFIEQMRGNVALSGAMSAITEAVVGVILNLAIWFGL
ncbi:MAG: chromate efflux transporter, partial [Rhizobiales bacterium]|nr:chromate efflux transporter [Hyphomicrobiales bacterium]